MQKLQLKMGIETEEEGIGFVGHPNKIGRDTNLRVRGNYIRS